MMRPTIWPVTPASAGTFTHSLLLGGTGVSVDALAGTAVAPALSPCQPLLRPTSPTLRRSAVNVIRPPRFGTSCHIMPLAFDMSIGLTMKKLAMYSTLPSLFRGATAISVMSVLSGSWGSSSPHARPVRVSYWPASPNDGQTGGVPGGLPGGTRSDEHTSELQSLAHLVCR